MVSSGDGEQFFAQENLFHIQRDQVNNSSFNEIKQERLALENNYLPTDLLRVLIHKIPYRSISPWARDGFAGT